MDRRLLPRHTMGNGFRTGIATFLLAAAVVPCGYAQTDDHKFALGGDFLVRVAPGDGAQGSRNIGVLWRFGSPKDGWRWAYGLNWFTSDIEQPVAGLPAEIGELRVRPFMAGYGYTHVRGRTSIEANLMGGYAINSIKLTPSASDVYRDRLGARSLSADVSNTFVLKPEVSVWFDLSRKVGLNVSIGYTIARPTLTMTSSVGSSAQRVHADMFMIKVGAVYKVF